MIIFFLNLKDVVLSKAYKSLQHIKYHACDRTGEFLFTPKKDNVMQEHSQLLSSLLVNITLSSSVKKGRNLFHKMNLG